MSPFSRTWPAVVRSKWSPPRISAPTGPLLELQRYVHLQTRQPGSILDRRNYASSIGEAGSPRPEDTRQRAVILGSGWAGYVLAQKLDKSKYQVLVVSPRSYFVFTPLLNDSAVGTLEFRNVLESLRKRKSNIEFLQGWADDVNFVDKTVTVEPNVLDQNVGTALVGNPGPDPGSERPVDPLQPLPTKGEVGGTGQQKVYTFPVTYDKLIIAVGCYSQTFNTEGVRENALFLKDVNDARRIRKRILDLFELAKMPFVPEDTKQHLLHFAVVGGGPTGMEFSACLSDLLKQDLHKIYPDLMKYVKISLYDVAPKVLPMFDQSLADYAVKQYQRKNIDIKTSHHVLRLRKGFPGDEDARNNQKDQLKDRVYTIETKEDSEVGIGMCVWSTGNMANPFLVKALDHVRRYPSESAELCDSHITDPLEERWEIERDEKTGLMLVDDHFRVQLKTHVQAESNDTSQTSMAGRAVMQDVYALGDTTIMKTGRLPGTAQVANQQAHWLAKQLNRHPDAHNFASVEGFGFKNLGVMTYVGGSRAVLQAPSNEGPTKGIKGWLAYLIWRGAYLTMTLSWRNKFLVPMQWFAVRIFGRDVSRF